jgi:hypothetical protein
MTLEAIEANTQILITLTYRQNQITGVGSWRIYYLDANLVAASDLYKHMDIINRDDGTIEFIGFFSILAGKAKWVVDISNSGTVTHAAVAAAPYTNGGWFVAVGVDVTGQEAPYFASSPTAIPATIVTGPGVGPLIDATSPSVVLTHLTSGGEFLDTVACTYTAPAPLGGFYGITPVIYNMFAAGTYQELGFYQYKGEGPGATVTFSFNILRDDGSNPGPAPGAHNVTIYFLAVDRVGGRIPQAVNSSPSVLLIGGFN